MPSNAPCIILIKQQPSIVPIVFINDIPKLKEAFLEYHIRAIASEKGLKTLNNILLQ